ncbi:MAG TPA: ArsR family transcriptional regulator [Planctomycetes bacterium]|nr:ArsR family transcriptional regulator [Planctomycetota bacterium]
MRKRKTPYGLFESRAKVAKALAHPSRLMILDALEEAPHCVCELTELVGADQSTVSKHLSVLKSAGLIQGRREGSLVWYSLSVSCLKGFWNCIDGVLKNDVDVRRQALKK